MVSPNAAAYRHTGMEAVSQFYPSYYIRLNKHALRCHHIGDTSAPPPPRESPPVAPLAAASLMKRRFSTSARRDNGVSVSRRAVISCFHIPRVFLNPSCALKKRCTQSKAD
ncbi:hypothetical protein EYF80_046637 [Liparis tanakae]|uniref:Uncharacterized protein n=1 Tax=Liparis tanakae TaxID=230148 RepID=A0A4Z2FQ93_9TELE|nr:hypothetical protein EYF80_046637 [Liparis tanakae]